MHCRNDLAKSQAENQIFLNIDSSLGFLANNAIKRSLVGAQTEILRHLEGFLCLVEHLYPIKGEYPDLLSHMTETDQVESPVEKPDPVRVHPTPALFLGAINHKTVKSFGLIL